MPTINVRLPDGKLQPMSYPEDWSQDQVKEAIYKNFPQYLNKQETISNINAIEDVSIPKETTGWKGLTTDIIKSLGSALKGGVRFAGRIPENLSEIGQEISKNPASYAGHAAGQLASGLVGGVRDIANIPHEIVEELRRKKITPEWLQTGSIPSDTGLEKFLGLEPKLKSDELVRAIPELAATGVGLTKVGKHFKAPDIKQSIRQTQKKVSNLQNKSGKIFDEIEKEVYSSNIHKVNIDQDLIKLSESFLAKTPANKKLINEAKAGDYKALRALQSDLRVKGEKALSSKMSSENIAGEEMLAARDEINKSIQNHLEKNGLKEASEKLNKNRNEYRELKEVYFSNPSLAKIFGKSQKVPRNPLTVLTEESTEMNRFLQKNPEFEKLLKKTLSSNKYKKIAKGLGKIAALSLGVEEARRLLP